MEATDLGGSAASLQLGVRLPEVAQPEVRDDGIGLVLVQQDVLELDVAVNDFLAVEVPDPGQDLSEECPEASNIKTGHGCSTTLTWKAPRPACGRPGCRSCRRGCHQDRSPEPGSRSHQQK